MKNNVRQPQQERSIEKKKRIVQAGYELFSEVGYYGTNTAEIAKRAGVSTGIVYGYFSDKRDILICVLEIYISDVFKPITKIFDGLSSPIDFAKVMTVVLEKTMLIHKKNSKIHEALHSLVGTDEAVNARFIALEDQLTIQIYDKLTALGVDLPDLKERIHFAMGIIQNYCHEHIYDKHEYIDYEVLHNMVIESLIKLFS